MKEHINMTLINRIKNYSAKKLIAPAMIFGASMLGYSQLQSTPLDTLAPIQTLMTSADLTGDGLADILHTVIYPKSGKMTINIFRQDTLSGNEHGNRMFRSPRDDPIYIEGLKQGDQVFILTGNFNIDDDLRDYKCSYDDILFGHYSPSKHKLTLRQFRQDPSAKDNYGNRMLRGARDDPIIRYNLPQNIDIGITVDDFTGDGREDIELKIFNRDTNIESMEIYRQYVHDKNDKFSNRMFRSPRDDPIRIKYNN